MNYIISAQTLREIESALLSRDPKEIARAREWISQIRACSALERISDISPMTISTLWAQEAPSIQNFAQSLLLKVSGKV
jgi:hypothetical protein